ncbi:ShlB/FhaC/HecB family hemolysin secretion/activation protein [Kingella sp. SNUBH-2017]|uniref:ShlB/FhaC/HecB family hemolysin secretion/activation protein n=1 Tax=Kingella sp. SNUBH-2017 TaxID=2994077 RepID=UPI0023634BBA|nr:ShlB/FhaC/HecB family hemolysin secretion/activation protein [Kingella sp. SNUBH-2017]MDD2181723.1 ShlB/FhaC/HecB family hemolysin secretion/activation protein [Kingella sp. SNUBH-2017]
MPAIHTHLSLAILAAFSFQAALADTIEESESRRQEMRRRQQEQQLQREVDVRLDDTRQNTLTPSAAESAESPCFPIHTVTLTGDAAGRFQFALKKALKETGFQSGQCLGAQGVNRIMVAAQNAVIGRGYTTTRILAAPQDLNSGTLELTVLPGKVRSVRTDTSHNDQTRAARIAAFQNEIPLKGGDILNLRRIEQGLENLKRVPTAEADIQIVPADAPDESDIVVAWRQRLLPYRLSLGVDDSGSKTTGKYQGSLTFSADNPFGLSDLFYLSYGRHLGHTDAHTDSEGKKTAGGTQSYAFHYSVPAGNWLWSWNHNYYRYHQAVAGINEVYDYNGKSRGSDIGFTRLLYRDARRKSHIGFKLWQKENQSFIDDAEVEVQRRKTAGWQLSLKHKEYIGRSTLDIGLAYKRGTGMADAIAAPEEVFDEGTSRMKVITADISYNHPFQIGRQHFVYDTALHAQWNKTPLTPLDKIAIGGRYTVRGFDGESSLSAERGWYWRNEAAWSFKPAHQFYLALDGGHVSGDSAQYLLGQTLIGAAAGLRGQFKAGGSLNYDLFVGKPIKKPKGFQTASTVFGFNLNYSF